MSLQLNSAESVPDIAIWPSMDSAESDPVHLAFSSDCAKIAFIIFYLTGQARSWVAAESSHRSAVSYFLPDFVKRFTQIFQ